MVICQERGSGLHTARLMPLPLTVSCFCEIQIGFTFLVLAHPGSPGQRAVKRACVVRSSVMMQWVGCLTCRGECRLTGAPCRGCAFNSWHSCVMTRGKLFIPFCVIKHPVWPSGHNAPLIRFLISVLCILFACLYRMLPHLSSFFTFSLLVCYLTYLFL